VLPGRFAVARLPAHAPIPDWASGPAFVSITRTEAALSIVCAESAIPDGVRAERQLACFEVEGPLDFSEVGVLASIARPLANAGISIFVVSTFDTDYIFVAASALQMAIRVLTADGYDVRRS